MIAQRCFIAAMISLALLPFAAAPASGADDRAKAAEKAAEAGATAPMLRESITVDGKVILLGDLFLNVGDLGHVAVAYAPAPGERAVFDARWLFRVARAYRLQWRPLSARQQAVVERSSQIIERMEIEDTIMAALLEKGADPESELEMTTQLSRLHVAADVQATIGVDDISFDPRTRRFAALVSAPANDPGGRKLRLTGRIHPVAKVPVPARTVGRGDTIDKRDIKWIRVRADRIMPDTVLKPEDLVGMSAKRSLRTEAMVRLSDVERPVLVTRGSLVTVNLAYGPMALSAQGKALEKGAMGDTIRIINTRSKTVFEGVVTGPGRARIDLTTTHELAATR